MLGRRVVSVLGVLLAVGLLTTPFAHSQVAMDDLETDSFADTAADDATGATTGEGAIGDALFVTCDPANLDLDDQQLAECEAQAAGEGGDEGDNGAEESAPHGGIAFSIGGFAPPPQAAPTTPTNPTCATSTLFSDGFASDPAPVLAATTLVNWNVQAGGNVDVVNPFLGANGNAIDLDGSTNVLPGDGTPVISLKVPIPVVAGRTYTAFYRIGTNPSPFAPGGISADVNNLNVTFGPASASHSKDPLSFGTETIEALTFVAATTGTAQLTFNDPDPDDRGGVILDEVTVTESCPA
jgi:hypothetical protein